MILEVNYNSWISIKVGGFMLTAFVSNLSMSSWVVSFHWKALWMPTKTGFLSTVKADFDSGE